MLDSDPPRGLRRPWFEPASVILMGAATFATAWSSFQSERWNSRAGELKERSDELMREFYARSIDSQQVKTVHFHLFSEIIDAKLMGNEVLSDFYAQRLAEELKPAYERWMAMRPFENASAPPHPFVPELYTPRYSPELRDFRSSATRAEEEGRNAGRYAESYLGNTVILAAALLFSGTARTFDQRRVRTAALSFAAVLFGYTAIRIGALPFI